MVLITTSSCHILFVGVIVVVVVFIKNEAEYLRNYLLPSYPANQLQITIPDSIYTYKSGILIWIAWL